MPKRQDIQTILSLGRVPLQLGRLQNSIMPGLRLAFL